jgi:capsular polysaccharide biosynthesis protein
MELYELIKIFKQFKGRILVITFLGLLIALGISTIIAGQQEATFSLIIRPKTLVAGENFQLTDVFEASDRVTRMTENWLKEQDLEVKTKRLGNQFIKISFNGESRSQAQARMEEVTGQSNSFLSSLSPTQELGAFEAVSSDFTFGNKEANSLIAGIAGLIVGMFIGLFYALFAYYFDKPKA